MSTVTVPARCDFDFEGRRFQTGEAVSVSAVTAAALHRQGKVTLAKGAPYHTRDLAPEPVSEPEPVLVAEPESPKRRRRSYRRRDLTAE